MSFENVYQYILIFAYIAGNNVVNFCNRTVKTSGAILLFLVTLPRHCELLSMDLDVGLPSYAAHRRGVKLAQRAWPTVQQLA